MGTCCWCTPGDSVIDLLKSYASSTLSANKFAAANDDLCYCMECVDEYHKAKDELPSFREILWKLETTRLITHFEKSVQEEDGSDLFIVDQDGETPLSHYTDSNFEKNLRVPLLEILKYPYLLLHEHLSELFVEVLCKMEEINCYQVAGKHPGIYLLMVHPNESIRRWAILTARTLGKVDKDDYYNIQEVLACLFRVIELEHFENPDIYNLAAVENGNLLLLPRHLYDTTSYKNYWLGISMLLIVLKEEAMDLLLFGPDKQIDFMQCIMKTMKKQTDDESNNPFWPALHCFMVILDKLGSKVWGPLINPLLAFQTVINNVSYQKGRETIRESCKRTKSEPVSDYGDEIVPCSQLVYDYCIENPHKDSICPVYCFHFYKDMQTLTDLFQSDISQDVRLHSSIFLWFIPFIHSLMELKDLGTVYSIEVIQHLCSEIKELLSDTVETCGKVSEFFIWILVTVLECHLKKNCLHSLWVSSEKWVQIVVKCARLPNTVFMPGIERGVVRNDLRSTVTSPSWEPESIQSACMKLIRNILKEGYQVVQTPTCKQLLDELNLLRRSRMHWELSCQKAQELQATLKEIIWSILSKSLNPSSLVQSTPVCVTPPAFLIKHKWQEDRCSVNMYYMHPPCLSPAGKNEAYQESPSPGRSCGFGKECWETSSKDQNLQGTSGCYLNDIKQEPQQSSLQEGNNLGSVLANRHMDAQKSVRPHQGCPEKCETSCESFGLGFQNLETKDFSTKEEKPRASSSLTEKNNNSSSALERKKFAPAAATSTTSPATESQIDGDLSKLSSVVYAKGTSLPIDSSQESSIHHQKCIKRKAKGAVRTWSASEGNKLSADADDPPNQVIFISDASSDEDENKMKAGREYRKGQVGVCLEKQFSAQEQESLTTPDSSLTYEECESHLLEFVKEEIHLEDSKTKTKPHTSVHEGHIGKEKAVLCSNFTAMCAGDEGCSRYTDPVLSSTSASASPSGSAPAVKESAIQPGKSSAKHGQVKTARESPKRSIKPSMDSKKQSQAKPARSAPAVVPPNEVHHIPVPTLVTEKLGLSEKVHRAAELSQCTQDSLAELCSSGENVGKVNVPQKRMSQLVKAQHLTTRNKRKVAWQKCRSYRQTNPKEREKCQCTHGGSLEAQTAKKPKMAELTPVQSASTVGVENEKESVDHLTNSLSSERKLVRQSSLERGVQLTPVSPVKVFPSTCQELTHLDINVQGRTTSAPTFVGSLSSAGASKTNPLAFPDPSSSPCDKDVALKEGEPQLNENKEGDGFSLTQLDPVDMELCSPIEDGNYLTNIEVNISASPLQGSNELYKQTSGTEKVAKVGAYCASHSACDPPDHVVARTLALPSLCMMKDFSSSSSSGSVKLTQELENAPKPPATSKSKPNPLKWGDLQLKTPTLSSVLQPQNSSNILQSLNVQKDPSVNNDMALTTPRPGSWNKVHQHFARANSVNAHRRYHGIFTREVLKWNYDMFANFKQFGPPSHLLQPIVSHVPVRFKDYDDYFNTFLPLMMLNAFEMMAQEWLKNQKLKEQRPFQLNLLNFNADVNEADFTTNISGSHLEKQVHPKEGDLVFLIVSEKQAFYSKEGKVESCPLHHVGYVTLFCPETEEQDVCYLSVKSQGNLSFVDKSVKCVVVGSLVTAQQMFKALLLLNQSPLAKAIISPQYADFRLTGSNVDSETSPSYMRELNEDQVTAIETAYAFVTQLPSLPKVCLIHGPPGTGKSKTILGLLYRILSERSGKENPVQSKIKRNRVLVCAPSDAAVDDLMKKMIVVFKEKCQNRDKPLGNCGDINLVRMGQEKSISKDIWKFSLDAQANHRMSQALAGKDQDIHRRKEEVDQRLDALSRQCDIDKSQSKEKKQQLEQETHRLGEESKRLNVQLMEVSGRSQSDMKANIILESNIICCTLSTSGSSLLGAAFQRLDCDPLSCVIVDMAMQSCEIETIIPLIHGCKKLVLVGDPKQLPPTVKSMKAEDYGYQQSLMGRLCRHLNGQIQEKIIDRLPILCLRTQYRMHPEICLFPSNYIYNSALKTDQWTEEDRFSLKWPFLPYLLFDVLDGQEEQESNSLINLQELKLVIKLITLMKSEKRDICFRNIGIITPYSAQKRRILSQLEKEFGENSIGEVDLVDGFQGREKDCIIVTCVRVSSMKGSIGFLKSLQQLNVTITRAKYSLFILGHLQTLMENEDWNALIQDAQKRGAIIKTSSAKYNNVPCYSSAAKKILKPMAVQQRFGRATQGQVSAAAELNEVPWRHSWQYSADAPAPGNSEAWHLPVSQDSSSSKASFPTQAKSVQERPRDPRLAKRLASYESEGLR